jgi:hypothetical protein
VQPKRPAKRPRGPWVQLACLCEGIEAEGSVLSLRRIIDVVSFDLTAEDETGQRVPISLEQLPPDAKPPTLNLHLIVALKSDDYEGSPMLTIEAELPNGERQVGHRGRARFLGRGHGYHINISLQMAVHNPGLFWFNVRVGRRLMARIPLDVRFRSPEEARSAQRMERTDGLAGTVLA